MILAWVAAFGKGFATMAALIVAIGIQNVFVLKQGLARQSTFAAATVCFLCDVFLVTIGSVGVGALITASKILNLALVVGGAIFLGVYGVRSLRAAQRAKGLDLAATPRVSGWNVVMTALAVSLLNPHAIIDTVVLVGGLVARYQAGLRIACMMGAMLASGVWFYGLAYGARQAAPFLAQPKVWRIIDLIIGCMMIGLAISLLVDGFALLQHLL